MKYQVIYTSKTGNTRKVAETIYSAISSKDKQIQELDPVRVNMDADIYYIGFWINRGSCSIDILNLLSELHGKKIALFGTCGAANVSDYYKALESEIDAFVPDDSEYLGMFLCQGEMPVQVQEKYQARLKENPQDPKIRAMLSNFESALHHPDQKDLQEAKAFTLRFNES